MAGDKGGDWLNSLDALWTSGSLNAWVTSLAGVFIGLLVLTAIVARVQGRSVRAAKVLAGSRTRARLAGRGVPPKNRKKKQDKIVRRYRPRSHDGKKPVRRVAQGEPAGPAKPKATAAAGTPAPQTEGIWRTLRPAGSEAVRR